LPKAAFRYLRKKRLGARMNKYRLMCRVFGRFRHAGARKRIWPPRNIIRIAITLIVPFAAGCPTDVVARLVTTTWRGRSADLRDRNLVGAGGNDRPHPAPSAPEGLLYHREGHLVTHAAAPALYPNLACVDRGGRNFEPIGNGGRHADPDLANKDSPLRGLKSSSPT